MSEQAHAYWSGDLVCDAFELSALNTRALMYPEAIR